MHDLSRPSILESWGVLPLARSLPQTATAIFGAADVPGSKTGLSSLALLNPRLGIPLWRGKFVLPRQALIMTLFNHRQTPVADGWSTLRTQVEDFRGRGLTYDSHNGTDFAIPRGTPVVAPAPGEIVRVFSEFNRGGRKIAIDHGAGLITCCAHLGRTLVQEGQRVARGEPIAVSGYSGLDGFATFPWGIPHVHFNTWLNGEPVDPFARGDEESIWIGGQPTPVRGDEEDSFAPSEYEPAAVDALIDACLTAEVRERLSQLEPLSRRAGHLVWERNYYPTRFPETIDIYRKTHPRARRINMPFSAEHFDGCTFIDELRAEG